MRFFSPRRSFFFLACVLFALSYLSTGSQAVSSPSLGSHRQQGVLEPARVTPSAAAKNMGRIFASASTQILADLRKVLSQEEYDRGVQTIHQRLDSAANDHTTALYQSARFALIEEWKDTIAHHKPASFLQASVTSSAEAQAKSALVAQILADLAAGAGAPWYCEASFAPGAQAVKEFTDQPMLVFQSAFEWKDATWATAKESYDAAKMALFNAFRAKFVRAVALYVKTRHDSCPNCLIKGSGSDDPASDIDLSVIGWGANKFVRQWNQAFETNWPTHKTAAEVFDVNLYSDSWAWPQSAYVNSQDEKKKDEKLKVNLLLSGGKVKVPLCYTLETIGNEQQYVFTVPSEPRLNPAQVTAQLETDETNQRRWAYVHMIVYRLDQIVHQRHAPVPPQCSYGVSAATLATCPTIAELYNNAAASPAALLKLKADLDGALSRLVSLVQPPCAAGGGAGAANLALCAQPGAKALAGSVAHVDMSSIAHRNNLNFQALDQFYAAIDPDVSMGAKTADLEYCLKTKNLLSTAAFYSQEAYLTKGALHHVVHAGQAGQVINWISRAEYFHSFVENWADYQKEVAHSAPGFHSLPNGNQPLRTKQGQKFLVKASKYLARMFDSHHRVHLNAEPLRGAVSAQSITFRDCAFDAIYTLQKKVRNKVVTDLNRKGLADTTDCAANVVQTCLTNYLGGGVRAFIDFADMNTAINRYANDVSGFYYNTYQPAERNNQADYLDKVIPRGACWAIIP